jgi:hypothetical protein
MVITHQFSGNTRSVYCQAGIYTDGSYTAKCTDSTSGGSQNTFFAIYDPSIEENSPTYAEFYNRHPGIEMLGSTSSFYYDSDYLTIARPTGVVSSRPSYGLFGVSAEDDGAYTKYLHDGWGAVGIITTHFKATYAVQFKVLRMSYDLSVTKSGSSYVVSLVNLSSGSDVISATQAVSTNKFITSTTVTPGNDRVIAYLGRLGDGGNGDLLGLYHGDDLDYLIYTGQKIQVTCGTLANASNISLASNRSLSWGSVYDASAYEVYIDQTSSRDYYIGSTSVTVSNSQYYGAHTAYIKAIGSTTPKLFGTEHWSRIGESEETIASDVLVNEMWYFNVDSGLSAYSYHNYVSAPTGLSWSRTGLNSASISWNSVTDAGHYEYSFDGGSWVRIGTATSASIIGIKPGSHSFKVRAYCDYSSEYGAESASISYTFPKISSPTSVAFTQAESGTTDSLPDSGVVSWSESDDYAQNYIINVDGVTVYDSGK